MPSGRLRLEGKVAFMTGLGSSGPGLGTGKAVSMLLTREGAPVLAASCAGPRRGTRRGSIRP